MAVISTPSNEMWTSTSKPAGPKENPKKRPGRKRRRAEKVVIENLYIRNGRIDIGSTISEKTMSAPLPDIHLTNIGKQKGGATPGEVAEKVIGALGQSVNTAVASVDTSVVLGEAKKQFAAASGGLEEKGKSALAGVKKLFAD